MLVFPNLMGVELRAKSSVPMPLETERLADFPDIELTIFTPARQSPVLAEVAFPASFTIERAKAYRAYVDDQVAGLVHLVVRQLAQELVQGTRLLLQARNAQRPLARTVVLLQELRHDPPAFEGRRHLVGVLPD